MSAPLQGMRVLDLSQQLPGPYATLLLAGLGADVTKVEPPAGDASRQLDPQMFAGVNAGKSSVVLDLKSDPDRERLYELVREHDVLVEGFRPGVTERLGCDHPTLQRIRPSLVYCSISGMGRTGPLAAHPTHDISLQAMAGILGGGSEVTRIGVPWVDLATATSAALAITAAWHAGQGCYLDLSMLDAAVAWARAKPSALEPGPEPTYGTLRAADGGRVVIALLEDHQWQRLCRALGWDDWVDDDDLARYTDRRRHGSRIRARLDESVGRLTVPEIVVLAKDFDLSIGPADAADDPASQQQIALRFPGEQSLPLPAALLRPLGPAPALDQHSTGG
ncbi:CoA transferase [Nakamurella sp. YIM 132087]|uniref:CoA transferase n=1 Tax=Nakamurella alba TaxID=2665158 RepID=A0A7K1FL00_9ACTN|nr:CoA transferase [Nakamurella alba]MTD14827.1 CoA transferase [Nakamurella alba]